MAGRYYYTDPLAAAWMYWHHGVNFTGPFEGGFQYQNDGIERREIEVEGSTRIYIHPDSLHLLEPMEGDIAEHDCIEFGFVIGKRDGEVAMQYCEDSDGNTLCGMALIEDITIIQRGGKPFHWPEQE